MQSVLQQTFKDFLSEKHADLLQQVAEQRAIIEVTGQDDLEGMGEYRNAAIPVGTTISVDPESFVDGQLDLVITHGGVGKMNLIRWAEMQGRVVHHVEYGETVNVSMADILCNVDGIRTEDIARINDVLEIDVAKETYQVDVSLAFYWMKQHGGKWVIYSPSGNSYVSGLSDRLEYCNNIASAAHFETEEDAQEFVNQTIRMKYGDSFAQSMRVTADMSMVTDVAVDNN